MSNSVRIDIFPALVAIVSADSPLQASELSPNNPSTAETQVNTARVVVTNDRIIIARDGGSSGPVVVFSEAIDPALVFKSQAPTKEPSYLTTVSGKKIAFIKDSACGCGSRLKSWRPFASASSVKDPTE